MAGVTSLARQTLAELMPSPEWREVVVGCLQEVEAAGRASGVNFPTDIHATTLAYIEHNLADLHASMHTDVMAGRPLGAGGPERRRHPRGAAPGVCQRLSTTSSMRC